MILDHVRHFEPGAARRRFEQGRQQAQEVLERLRALPDGERRAEETTRMIDRVRTFIGYREYPKYSIISRSFVYRQAIPAGAERLVRAGVLAGTGDAFYLTFPELHDAVRTNRVDATLVRQRRAAFRSYQALRPPRVLTSDGEAVTGAYRRAGVPAGALIGRPVSAGTVEGAPGWCSTWPRPISNLATSWSRRAPTRAGHPCSLRPPAWSRRSAV